MDPGQTDEDALVENLSDWHNEYLDYYLAACKEDGINDVTDPGYDDHFRGSLNYFFTMKGLTLSHSTEYFNCPALSTVENNIDLDESLKAEFDSLGASLLDSVIYMLDNRIDDPAFDVRMESLYVLSNNIGNSQERLALKLGIMVAKKSRAYWNENSVDWTLHFAGKPDIDKGQIVKRDVGGAVKGAFGGFIFGGPAGAVAFGLLTASWESAVNIVYQSIK
ncbi:MAG: hypothetical protein EOO01_25850 [Chitinophagaceae bacterium]|nr:MAG: hypothetical protein EOO01_25850 [Chitinophagaceae bacterium]